MQSRTMGMGDLGGKHGLRRLRGVIPGMWMTYNVDPERLRSRRSGLGAYEVEGRALRDLDGRGGSWKRLLGRSEMLEFPNLNGLGRVVMVGDVLVEVQLILA